MYLLMPIWRAVFKDSSGNESIAFVAATDFEEASKAAKSVQSVSGNKFKHMVLVAVLEEGSNVYIPC